MRSSASEVIFSVKNLAHLLSASALAVLLVFVVLTVQAQALQAETLAQSHNLQGVAYMREGNRKEAKEALRKAIKADPEYAPAHNNLGYLLYQEAIAKTGEVDGSLVNEALGHLKTALKYAVRPEIIRQVKENQAMLYTDTRFGLSVRGDDWYQKGINIYESLIREEPENPEYHMRFGFACFQVTNPGGGFSELGKASELAKGKNALWIHKELQKFYMQINFVAKAEKERKIIEALEHE